MNDRLSKLLGSWALQTSDSQDEDFLDYSSVQYLGRIAFDDYEPSQVERFEERLDRWLHNVTAEKDRQTLFLLLNYLFYIGRPEFESLCRTAYHGHVVRWLIEQLDVDLTDPNGMKNIEDAISSTWFCPITDSMRINWFLKANGIVGHSHRPDWRSLRKFGEPGKIKRFLNDNCIQRVVLLEDFVGSGTQIRSAVEFASRTLPDIPILALPLVACPAGDDVGCQLAAQYANVDYEAVMLVPPDTLIKPDAQPDEPPFYRCVRQLILRFRSKLSQPASDEESQRYHGYKGTGAVTVMYSNCPNNTLPIIYDETRGWRALFPRIGRR